MDILTRQMLDTIRKRISNLERMKELILEEYGDGPAKLPAKLPVSAASSKKNKANNFKSVVVNGKSRKVQLHEWLKENGPSTRSEIINGSGLPSGTISGYLSVEKDLFETRDGKWHAR